jgi:hypothetical protein
MKKFLPFVIIALIAIVPLIGLSSYLMHIFILVII